MLNTTILYMQTNCELQLDLLSQFIVSRFMHFKNFDFKKTRSYLLKCIECEYLKSFIACRIWGFEDWVNAEKKNQQQDMI